MAAPPLGDKLSIWSQSLDVRQDVMQSNAAMSALSSIVCTYTTIVA